MRRTPGRAAGLGLAALSLAAGPSPASALTLDPSAWRPFGGLSGGLGGSPTTKALEKPLGSLKSVFLLIFALGTITAILFLMINITRLGGAGDNPAERRNAILGILFSGVALALLGGLSFVLALAWNFL